MPRRKINARDIMHRPLKNVGYAIEIDIDKRYVETFSRGILMAVADWVWYKEG